MIWHGETPKDSRPLRKSKSKIQPSPDARQHPSLALILAFYANRAKCRRLALSVACLLFTQRGRSPMRSFLDRSSSRAPRCWPATRRLLGRSSSHGASRGSLLLLPVLLLLLLAPLPARGVTHGFGAARLDLTGGGGGSGRSQTLVGNAWRDGREFLAIPYATGGGSAPPCLRTSSTPPTSTGSAQTRAFSSRTMTTSGAMGWRTA